jgi:hypothetical protein|nr:MAG TPA: Protein of unknown function (DUF2624) [Bacteriophage sp.]
MDDNLMERQIADYMVKYGTENTNYGAWVFEVDELAKKFDVTEEWIQEHEDGIMSELYLREEVADVERELSGNDMTITLFDVDFYTNYCPNYIEDEQEKDDDVNQYWFAETRWCIDDVIDAAKKKGIVLTPQQAESWWEKNEKRFKDIIVEHGNEVLEDADFDEV